MRLLRLLKPIIYALIGRQILALALQHFLSSDLKHLQRIFCALDALPSASADVLVPKGTLKLDFRRRNLRQNLRGIDDQFPRF